MKSSTLEKTVIALCLFLIMAYFVSSFFPQGRLWGINHLAYFPLHWRVMVVFAGLVLVSFALNSRLLDLFKDKTDSPIFRWMKEHRRWTYVIISGTFFVIFWLLRTRTCLLGDGYLRADEISTGIRPRFTEFLDMRLHTILYDLFHQIFNWDAYTVYALVSCLSGAIFVFFVLLLGDLLSKRTMDKVPIFGLLVLSGGSQLFLGYVESYTIAYVAIFIFIYFSIGYLKGKNSLILPCAVLLLCVFFHFSALYLFPSFLFLLLAKSPDQKFADSKGVLCQKFLCLILIGLSAVFGFYLLKLYAIKEAGQKLSYFLIPLIGSKDNPYSLFSFSHLLDIVNQQLLVSPVGIVIWIAVFVTLRKRLDFRSPRAKFLLLVTLFSLGFAFLVNPVLGYARDWDLFASTGLGYTILGACVLVDFLKESTKTKYVFFAVSVTLLITSLPWFLINAHLGRSVKRFENLLGLYQRGKPYGHETLSLCYREQGMIEREMEELEKAMTLEKHPRYLAKLGAHYDQRGELNKAMLLFKNAIHIDSTNPDLHNSLGAVYFKKGLFEEATLKFEKAIQLRPSNSTYYVNLGHALSERGLIQDAIEQYEKAKKLDSEDPATHYHLGLSYAQQGLFDKAILSYKKSLELKPDFAETCYDLGTLYFGMNRIDEAIVLLEKAIEIRPDYASAHYNLGVALVKKGLSEKAADHFQHYLDLSQDTTDKRKMEKVLEDLRTK